MAVITSTNTLVLLLSIVLYSILNINQPNAYDNPLISNYARQGSYYNYYGRSIYTYNTASIDPDALNKPKLLLLHGYPTSSIDWYHMIHSHLIKQWHCITYDYIGYGLSDKSLPYNTSIYTQADVAESLLMSLDIKTVHLLTHDVGNTVAQELLGRQLDSTSHISIKSVVLLNGGLFPEQHRATIAQRLLLTPYIGDIIQLLPRTLAGNALNHVFGAHSKLSTDELELYTTLLYHNAQLGLLHQLQQYIVERRNNRERWVTAIQNITKTNNIPLRLINGPADPVSGRHMAEYYQQIIESADVIILNDTIGHYPQLEDEHGVLHAFQQFHHDIGTKL